MARDIGSEDDWEEEESLLLVELSGVIDFNMITSSDPDKCNVLGLNTDRPLLQLDRCVFVGEYQETLGTLMLFEEITDAEGSQSGKSSDKTKLVYAGKTCKQLVMKRAFVTEVLDSNVEMSEPVGTPTSEPECERLTDNTDVSPSQIPEDRSSPSGSVSKTHQLKEKTSNFAEPSKLPEEDKQIDGPT